MTGKSGYGNGSQYQGSKWCRKDFRLACYMRDSFACAYCGRDLRNAAPAEITLDHLLPRIAGGGNESTNIITACRSCNSSRGDKPYASYATGGALDRIEELRHKPLNRKLAQAIIDGTAGDPEIEAQR